jgi:uncharacterized protein involved in exopolysaccharide biosynthesis
MNEGNAVSTIEYRESEPFTEAASGPLASWRRHWVLATLVAVLGAGLGATAGFLVPATYTAEARVAVGSGDLTSGAIAGFPVAASQLASNYARYVNIRGVAGTDVPENVSLSASQIPDSNVIRIEADSADPAAARAAANTAAQQLIEAVNGSGKTSADDVYAEFQKAAKADAAAQTDLAAAQHTLDNLLGEDNPSKADVKDARGEVTAATAKAAETGLTVAALRQRYTNLVSGSSTAANLLLIRTADGLSSNRTSLVTRMGLVGLAGGIVLGLILAVAVDRRRVRRTSSARTNGAVVREPGRAAENLGV